MHGGKGVLWEPVTIPMRPRVQQEAKKIGLRSKPAKQAEKDSLKVQACNLNGLRQGNRDKRDAGGQGRMWARGHK